MAKEEEEAEEMTEAADVVHAWSWGAGTDGQLGTGVLQDQLLPQPLSHLPASVSRIACGGAHAIALTDLFVVNSMFVALHSSLQVLYGDGSVLTWGRGTQGQLGHGKLERCSQPKPVKNFKSFTVSYVSAGWNHSGFVTDTGRLFMCGDGSFGQLGNGDNQSLDHPCEVLFFPSGHVKQIACGMRHSLALVKGSSGVTVYGFGSGRHGQIGRHLSQSQRTVNFPVVVEGLKDCELVSIHASGDHSAALSADGQLYIWGRRFGGNVDSCIPQLVPLSLPISHVAFGWNHALVMAGGLVYMLGGNRHGLLSGTQEANTLEHRLPTSASCTTSDESVLTLERVVFPVKQKAVSVAAGAEHSAVVTEKGLVMTWGWGEHGQLGLGDTFDRTAPQMVNLNWIESFSPSQLAVYCGSGFTIVAKSTQ